MTDNPETQETPPSTSVPPSLPYQLGPDEKVTPVMLYGLNGLARGELISKQLVRVSTWLRSVSGITYITLYRAQVMSVTGSGTPQIASYSELHTPINQVVAYHLLPPAQEPLDYDPTEPHRQMIQLILSFGPFRAVGKLRIGETTNLATHLRTSREAYMSIYDVEVSNPSFPKMAAIKSPLMLVQPNMVFFALKA